MNYYILIFLFVWNIILPLMFNILNIDISYFLNYLIWVNILVLLYYILPSKVGKVFE